MNVATLELCKELYGLSGWDDTPLHWSDHEFGHTGGVHGHSEEYELITGWVEDIETGEEVELLPAYTLGYLLRNLPKSIERDGRHYALHLQHDLSRTLWRITYGGTGKLRQNMSTGRAPEDAAAKIAIELFKQGILKREES